MKTKIFTICLCLLISVCLAAIAQDNYANGTDDYSYYLKDKKVTLDPLYSEIFVTFASEVSLAKGRNYASTFSNQVEKAAQGDVFSPVKAMRFRLNAGKSASGSTFQDVLKKFKSNPDVVAAYPAFKIGEEKVYVSNKIAYTIKPGIDTQKLSALLSSHKSAVIEEINLGDHTLFIVAVNKSNSVFKVASTLYESGLVEYAEPDFTFTGKNEVIPNDTFFGSQWFLNQSNDADIDAPEAWNITTGLNSVVVAVIDGHGYDLFHPDLAGKLVSSYDAVNDDNFPWPENANANHGTPCAGLIAAATNNGLGVAGTGYNVRTLPISIGFGATVNGSFSTNATIVARAAARVVATAGVVAVSNSYSFGSAAFAASVEASYTSMRNNSRGGLGAVILASTANDGLNNPTVYPASYANVIGVGASTSSDTRAGFSNYGGLTDVVAPGVSTYTIDRGGTAGYSSNDYTFFSGTSAACPVAAGVIGIIASANSGLNWAQLAAYLQLSCDKVGGYAYSANLTYGTWNNEMGYGRVNAFKAAQLAQGAPTISSFTPGGGPAYTSVTIYGNKFLGATSVLFNGVSTSFTVISNTTIVATVPASATTGPIKVTTFAGTATSSGNFTITPYCVPAYSSNSCTLDYINRFSLNTLFNNASGCNGQPGNYINYAPSGLLTTTVLRGSTYTIGLQSGPTWAQGFGVWIDYNDDKDFADAGEFVYGSPTATTALVTANITIPAGTSTGKRRVRVRSRYNNVVTASDYCSSFSYGETEDYTITIGYCVPTTACNYGDYINNFSFNTLVNNGSACNGQTDAYINYSPIGTYTTSVVRGQSYNLKVQSGPTYAQSFGVWIDYNNDQDFNDGGEFIYSSPTASTSLYTTTVTIPLSTSIGQKRLRVRSRYSTLLTSADACLNYTYGETEDYTITVTDPVVASSQWNKRFGGSATDNFSVVIKTSDGGYLLGGHSLSGISGDKTQAGQGNFDFWIVKTDAAGNKQWDKRFGGNDADYLNSAIQTSDGGYLLGGNSISGISGDKTQASQGGRDFWVVKINNLGVKQWDKRFGGSGDEDLRTLIQTAAGFYFLAGYSSSPVSGDKSQGTQGYQDYWIVKITPAGAKIFDKRFGGSGNDFLEGVAQTADGGFILGGHSQSGISGDKTQASRGASDYWLVRINGAGAKIWDKRFGGAADDVMTSIGRTAAGFFYVAGFSNSGAGGDKSQGNQGGKDYWMLKITPDGAKLWDKRFGGTADEELRSIVQTTDGGYIIGGKSLSGISGDKTQDSRGNNDYWVVKTDGNGNKQWDKRFGGSAAEDLRTVLQTADGGYVLGGRSDSGAGGDKTQPSQGSTDYWLVKLSPAGGAAPVARIAAEVSEEGKANEVLNITASPNPFTEKVTVEFTLQQTEQATLRIYDSQGSEVKQLYSGQAEAGKHYEFDWVPSGHKAGMYIIRLGTSSQISTKKIVMVK